MCPWREAQVWPESASQTRAVLSHEAVTTRLLSGLNAAELTGPLCPGGERGSGRSRRPRPAPYCPLEAEAARLPSGLEPGGGDEGGVPLEGGEGLARVGVPDPRRPVP